MFLCQLDKTASIFSLHVAQTDNAPANTAFLSSLSSQRWVRVGVDGLVNALMSLQAGFHAEGDHTIVPTIPDPTIGDTCTDNTFNCPKKCVDIGRVGYHAPRRSCYTAQGRGQGVNCQHLPRRSTFMSTETKHISLNSVWLPVLLCPPKHALQESLNYYTS